MNKKNKILAVLAIGAVTLLVVSGVARCSLQGGQEQKETPKKTEASTQQSPLKTGAELFSEYENTTWSSTDGKYSLNILPGVMVEKGPDRDAFWYYEIDEAKADENGLSATLMLKPDQGTKAAGSAISIVKGNGSATLACDALKADYVMLLPDAASITLVGFEAGHAEFGGKTEGEFAEAVAKAASARSPYAKNATWSKEVWIDYATGNVVTNFRLDDGASTTVSVTVTKSGELVAS